MADKKENMYESVSSLFRWCGPAPPQFGPRSSIEERSPVKRVVAGASPVGDPMSPVRSSPTGFTSTGVINNKSSTESCHLDDGQKICYFVRDELSKEKIEKE